MKKFLFFAVAILALTSCGDSDPKSELTIKQTLISRNFVEGSTNVNLTEGDYTFVLDLVGMKVNVTGHKVTLPGISGETTFTMSEMSLKPGTNQNKYWYTFEAASVTAKVNDVVNPDLKITNVKGSITAFPPYQLYVQYTVADNNNIIATPQTTLFSYVATTISQIGSTDKPYENNDAMYTVVLDSKKNMAKITIFNAKFAPNMPYAEMELRDIPFEATPGAFKLKADKITPYISNVPYEKYEITQLSGLMYSREMSMSFVCGGIYNTTSNAYVFKPEGIK